MLYEPQGIELFLRLAAATALALVGLVLLWQSFTESSLPRSKPAFGNINRWLGAVSAKPALLRPIQPLAPRLRPGAELGRLASVIDAAQSHVQTVNANQVAAAVQIDAAEHALNRLIGEIAEIMPSVMKPTMVPRRAFDVDAVETPAALAA
jgi:hypothetical protein